MHYHAKMKVSLTFVVYFPTMIAFICFIYMKEKESGRYPSNSNPGEADPTRFDNSTNIMNIAC